MRHGPERAPARAKAFRVRFPAQAQSRDNARATDDHARWCGRQRFERENHRWFAMRKTVQPEDSAAFRFAGLMSVKAGCCQRCANFGRQRHPSARKGQEFMFFQMRGFQNRFFGLAKPDRVNGAIDDDERVAGAFQRRAMKTRKQNDPRFPIGKLVEGAVQFGFIWFIAICDFCCQPTPLL